MNILQQTASKTYSDASWDFRTANTKNLTHCFHNYPAMMIPQVASRILSEYGCHSSTLLDPYCGTGTSLVEAVLCGIRPIGIDLNPLARMIAQAKTTPLALQTLDLYLHDYVGYTFGIRFNIQPRSVIVPDFPNRDFWFRPSEQRVLASIKHFIDNIEDPDIARFFSVAFSETVRDASLTKKGEFKLVRMSEQQQHAFSPDVFGIMEAKLSRNRNGLKEYMHRQPNHPKVTLYSFNTVQGVPSSLVEPESIDIVLTSPPYGDSSTTVAYGQFSRLSSQWLGFSDPQTVDKQLMGGIRTQNIPHFSYQPLNETLERIATLDEKRALDVAAFYHDYQRSIAAVATTIRRGGIAAYVVGNRKVKGMQLPTDAITQALFEQAGFRHEKTIIRSIPNKRMPSRNSPTNIPGMLDETMSQEYIIIMKKM